MNGSDIRAALTAMLSGKMDTPQIVDTLIQIENEGVGTEQLSAGVDVMRKHMVRVKVPENAIDIVGTGGTGLKTLSISTAAALVVAGAGVPVAKHGNRGASSPTGTADTLSELGVNISMRPKRAAAAVSKVGMGFLFAPTYHPALRHVGPARKQIGKRTIFNRLGPLCNPASVKYMLVGSAEEELIMPMGIALRNHVNSAMIVHGTDGLDEITTTGKTQIVTVNDCGPRPHYILPEKYGIPRAAPEALQGGDPKTNAAALIALLNGTPGPYADIVLLNAGTALNITRKATSIENGIALARESIDSGKAKSVLTRLAEFSHG